MGFMLWQEGLKYEIHIKSLPIYTHQTGFRLLIFFDFGK